MIKRYVVFADSLPLSFNPGVGVYEKDVCCDTQKHISGMGELGPFKPLHGAVAVCLRPEDRIKFTQLNGCFDSRLQICIGSLQEIPKLDEFGQVIVLSWSGDLSQCPLTMRAKVFSYVPTEYRMFHGLPHEIEAYLHGHPINERLLRELWDSCWTRAA